MNIVTTNFDLSHNAFEFFFSGCNFHCSGCQNSELWDFNVGEPWQDYLTKNKTIEKILEFGNIIHKVVILGGEPFHQNLQELFLLVKELKKIPADLWIFTGFTDIELEQYNQFHVLPILDSVDYVKYGKYDETCLSDTNYQHGYKLASANQYVIRYKNIRSL